MGWIKKNKKKNETKNFGSKKLSWRAVALLFIKVTIPTILLKLGRDELYSSTPSKVFNQPLTIESAKDASLIGTTKSTNSVQVTLGSKKKKLIIPNSRRSLDSTDEIQLTDFRRHGPYGRGRAASQKNQSTSTVLPAVQGFTPSGTRRPRLILRDREKLYSHLKPSNGRFNSNSQNNLSLHDYAVRICKTYRVEIEQLKSKMGKDYGLCYAETKFSKEEFQSLAKDHQGEITKTGINEALAAFKLKESPLGYRNIRRFKSNEFDFIADRRLPGRPSERRYVDMKRPAGPERLEVQKSDRSFDQMAYDVGVNVIKQKFKHVRQDTKNMPNSPMEVSHVLDLCEVPRELRDDFVKNFREGMKKTLEECQRDPKIQKNLKREYSYFDVTHNLIHFVNDPLLLPED